MQESSWQGDPSHHTEVELNPPIPRRSARCPDELLRTARSRSRARVPTRRAAPRRSAAPVEPHLDPVPLDGDALGQASQTSRRGTRRAASRGSRSAAPSGARRPTTPLGTACGPRLPHHPAGTRPRFQVYLARARRLPTSLLRRGTEQPPGLRGRAPSRSSVPSGRRAVWRRHERVRAGDCRPGCRPAARRADGHAWPCCASGSTSGPSAAVPGTAGGLRPRRRRAGRDALVDGRRATRRRPRRSGPQSGDLHQPERPPGLTPSGGAPGSPGRRLVDALKPSGFTPAPPSRVRRRPRRLPRRAPRPEPSAGERGGGGHDVLPGPRLTSDPSAAAAVGGGRPRPPRHRDPGDERWWTHGTASPALRAGGATPNRGDAGSGEKSATNAGEPAVSRSSGLATRLGHSRAGCFPRRIRQRPSVFLTVPRIHPFSKNDIS